MAQARVEAHWLGSVQVWVMVLACPPKGGRRWVDRVRVQGPPRRGWPPASSSGYRVLLRFAAGIPPPSTEARAMASSSACPTPLDL